MIEYVFIRNEDGDIEPCDACHSEVPTAEYVIAEYAMAASARAEGNKRLCEVCANCDTGNIVERPTANDPMLRSISAAANQILKAMGCFNSARVSSDD